MAEGKQRGTYENVQSVLSGFADTGVINLDVSVRELMAPRQALAQLQQPGSEVAAAVVAWDGYALVIASQAAKPQELLNVARELRETTGGKG